MAIISINTLASSATLGLPTDPAFFAKLGSSIVDWVKLAATQGWTLLKKMQQGGSALIESIKKGNFISIFKAWAKENPLAAIAGVVAAGAAAAVIIIVGGTAIAAAVGGIGAIVGSVGILGTIGASVTLGGIVTPLLNQAEVVYSMNWQISDTAIMDLINSYVTSLYGPAGEFLGRALASVAAGGISRAPQVRVNIRRLSLSALIHPEAANDIQMAAAQLSYMGLFVARRIAVLYSLMKGRKAIKNLWKKLPEGIRSNFPQLTSAIATWGDKDKEPWSMENSIEEKIESIDDARLQQAAEGFLEGFWEQFRDSIEYQFA